MHGDRAPLTIGHQIMNAEWNSFFERAGAVRVADRVVHFGQPAAELGAALVGDVACDLSHLGLIAARGPDADNFLQGQSTCDVRQVTLEHSLPGAHCTLKGRVFACFRMFRRGDACYLELPRTLMEPTLNRLRKYLLRAKATLEDCSDSLARIGVAGPTAAVLLEQTLGRVPEDINGVIHARGSDAAGITVIRLPGPTPRFELHGAVQDLSAVWNILIPAVMPVGTEPWRLLDILAGTPAVYPETVEAFVPQMLNLQLLGGISFQKGCYTGQEIVARTHYLGKLKRRMVLGRVDSPIPPRPGDPLFSPQADASQSAGQLADACRHPEGDYAVLAVALIECAERGTLHLSEVGGPVLRLESLPYDFEAAD